MGSTATVDMGQHLEEVMTYTLPAEQMQIQIATAIWAAAMNVHPMQMLHSSLANKILLSVNWKCFYFRPQDKCISVNEAEISCKSAFLVNQVVEFTVFSQLASFLLLFS